MSFAKLNVLEAQIRDEIDEIAWQLAESPNKVQVALAACACAHAGHLADEEGDYGRSTRVIEDTIRTAEYYLHGRLAGDDAASMERYIVRKMTERDTYASYTVAEQALVAAITALRGGYLLDPLDEQFRALIELHGARKALELIKRHFPDASAPSHKGR